jgi:fumarate reductase flavoprotein subunit
MEVPGIRFDDTMYLLEKLAARGVDYLHFSVGATLRPSIVDTQDPTPLIEKYCAMRSDTLAQIPVMGVGGVVNAADANKAIDSGYDLIAVGRATIAYPDWTDRIAAGETLELFMDSTQREALSIPEPLWRFSLVEAMIRDMSMGESKFKPGMFAEKVQDDVNELVINVSLETDRIADIELASGPSQDVEFVTSFEEIRTRILDANTPHVDAITGATSQSEAVKKPFPKQCSNPAKPWQRKRGRSKRNQIC